MRGRYCPLAPPREDLLRQQRYRRASLKRRMKSRLDSGAIPHADVSAISPKSQGPLLELSVCVCDSVKLVQVNHGRNGVWGADKMPWSDYGIFLVGEIFILSAEK